MSIDYRKRGETEVTVEGPVNITNTDFPDEESHELLQDVVDGENAIIVQIEDNGNILEEIRDGVANLPVTVQTDALTDTELRAAPVPVSGPLTDAQLRASSVPVTVSDGSGPITVDGTVSIGNASGASAVNIQDGGNSITVDGPLTDAQLRAAVVPVSVPGTVVVDEQLSTPQAFGPLSASSATVLLSTEAKGRFFSIQYTSATGSNITIEGSNDNATWVCIGASPFDAQNTNATGVSSSIQRAQCTVWTGENPFRYIRFSTTSTTATTVYILISSGTLARPHTRYATGDSWTDGLQMADIMSWTRLFNGSSWDRARSGRRAHLANNTLVGALQVVLNQTEYSTTASTTGAIASQGLGQTVRDHSFQITQSSGTTTAVKVELQGSLGNSAWFTLGTWELGGSGTQALNDIVFVTGKPVLFIRFNVVSITGGTIKLLYAGAV